MTHHESQGHDSNGSYADRSHDPFERLDDILERDAYRLKQLSASTTPLTVDRLARIDPLLADQAEALAETDTRWPDGESAALRPPYTERWLSLTGEDADLSFIIPILIAEDDSDEGDETGRRTKPRHPLLQSDEEWAKGYNNFFMNLKTPQRTASPEVVHDRIRAGDMPGLTYGTKPYLERAYALVPEFMTALQEATERTGSMEAWKDAMKAGHLQYDDAPDNATLLRSTRMAYVLLGRLMRRDDLMIQKQMLGMTGSQAPLIDNPANELAT